MWLLLKVLEHGVFFAAHVSVAHHRPDFTSLSHSSPLFCGPFDVSLPIVGGTADLEATETIQIGTLADFLLIFPNLLL